MASRNTSQVVTDETLRDLTPKVGGEWKRIGRELGLSPPEMSHIQSNNIGNQMEMVHEMFYTWKCKQGNKATKAVLAAALEKASKSNLAVYVRTGVMPTSNTEDVPAGETGGSNVTNAREGNIVNTVSGITGHNVHITYNQK